MNIQEIEARLEAASPGPWAWESVGENSWCLGVVDPPMHGEILERYDESSGVFAEKPVVVECVAEGESLANAAFIAHARTDVQDLVAEVKRLRAALEWYADPSCWERNYDNGAHARDALK